jgi:hypothetical protein
MEAKFFFPAPSSGDFELVWGYEAANFQEWEKIA